MSDVVDPVEKLPTDRPGVPLITDCASELVRPTTSGTVISVGVIEVSPTETVELVATIVPEVDTVLKRDKKDSVPSVVESFASVTAKEPESETIETDPPDVTAFAGELKSASDTPSIVQ